MVCWVIALMLPNVSPGAGGSKVVGGGWRLKVSLLFERMMTIVPSAEKALPASASPSVVSCLMPPVPIEVWPYLKAGTVGLDPSVFMLTKYSVLLATLKKMVQRLCGGRTVKSATFIVKTSWFEHEFRKGSASDTF